MQLYLQKGKAEAQYVCAGIIISSLFFNDNVAAANSIAEVPQVTAKLDFYLINIFENSFQIYLIPTINEWFIAL